MTANQDTDFSSLTLMHTQMKPLLVAIECRGMALTGISVVFFYVNMVLDLINAYGYVQNGKCWYGFCLLFAHLLPSVVMMTFSHRMWDDLPNMCKLFMYYSVFRDEINSESDPQSERKQKGIMNIIQNPPISRSLKSIYFAVQAQRAENLPEKEKYIVMMNEESETRSLLNVVASVVESGLQLIVQIMFLINDLFEEDSNNHGNLLIYASIVTSFVFMALSLIVYLQNIHSKQGSLKWWSWGSIMQYFSNFCNCFSQVVMLCVLLYATWWTLLGVCVHWVLTTVWNFRIRPIRFYTSIYSCHTGRSKKCEDIADFLTSAYIALIHIITYIPFCEGSNFFGYLLFFVCSSVYNITGAVVWFKLVASIFKENSSFILYMPFIAFILFLVGLCLTVLYYRCIHPKRDNLTCMPCRT